MDRPALRSLGRWSLGFVVGFLVTLALGGGGWAIILGILIMCGIALFVPFWQGTSGS